MRALFSIRPRALGGWLLLFALTLGAAESPTVILHLKNGDRLTGTIVAEDEAGLIFNTRWQKELPIPLDQIERREVVAPEPPAEAAAPKPPEPLPPTDPPPPPPQKKRSYWSGDAQLGLDLAYSEKDRQLYHGRLKVTYAKEPFRHIFDYKAAYGTTDNILSANRMDGSVKTDFDLGKKVFVYNLAGAGYDEIRRVDLQYEMGPGFGYRLLALTNFVMNAELGASYLHIDFANGRRREEINLRLAEDLTWKLNSRVSLEEKFEYMPRADNFSSYRLRFESTLRFWLLQNLSLNFSVIDIYDTRPAQNVTKNDLQIRSSLGVKF